MTKCDYKRPKAEEQAHSEKFNDQCSLLFDAAPTWFNSLDKSIASIGDKNNIIIALV